MMALDAELREILQGLQSDMEITIQLTHLLPILSAKRLVTQSEFQELSNDGKETDLEKNRKLIRIIIGKGEKAFDLFIEALQEEREHLGHDSLAKKLMEKRRSKAKSKPRAPEPLPRSKPTSVAPTPPPKPNAKPPAQQVSSSFRTKFIYVATRTVSNEKCL